MSLYNSVVEKADPNILYRAGKLTLDGVRLRNSKTFDINNMGHGLWTEDSGKAEEYELRKVLAVGCKGDGLNVGRSGRIHFNLDLRGNNGWGLNVERLGNPPFRSVINDRDPDKNNGKGDISDPTKVELDHDALS